MDTKPERIAKRMSALGLCSRRDAERWIEAGRVAVNGKLIDSPVTLVSLDDEISVDGQKVEAAERTPVAKMWLYHKPTGLVTTHRDEKGRDTVFDHLPPELPRVVSVGRLDLNSEGLLLLTTSGELSRALELPKNALPRSYRVRVNGTPTAKHLHMIAHGVTIDGIEYQPIRVALEKTKDSGRNQWLTLVLREGKNREIRRIFEHFDYPVSRLIRTEYGPFALGSLKPGEVRPVPQWQIEKLLQKLSPRPSESERRGQSRAERGNDPGVAGANRDDSKED